MAYFWWMNIFVLMNFVFIFNGLPISDNNNQNPEQMAGFIEGDMIIPKLMKGVGYKASYHRWKDGTVPYVMTSSILPNHSALIVQTMRIMEDRTSINGTNCIKFRPKVASDSNYIIIQNSTGCSATVGAWNGYDVTHYLNLMYAWPYTCMTTGIIQHELLHILGFFHEQSRPDRDSYISIQWSNIQSGMEYNFDKYTDSVVDTLGISYDYGSVMHYDPYAFSNNGLRTIIPTKNSSALIGQRVGMSSIDILEVQRYYNNVPILNKGKLSIILLLLILSGIYH